MARVTNDTEFTADFADAYDHLSEEEFHGEYCSCGRRMHASDVECERCYRDREFPES